jgi:hypothetical protein
MTAINRPAREVRDVLDFGTNAAVYHTSYFRQRETAESIARWLGLAGDMAPRAASDPATRSRGEETSPA